MPDYSKCCIYKLCCKDATVESIYIGSTTNPTKRKCDHKKCFTKVNDKEYNINLLEIMEGGTIGI